MTPALVLVTDSAPYAGQGAAGVHHALPQAVGCFRQLARAHGLAFTHVEDVTVGLPDPTVLVLFTIGDVPWSAQQRGQIEQRVRTGATQVLSVHSATDANHDWDAYGQLTGGRFDGHPVSAELSLHVDRAHPATQHLPQVWTLRDELYLFRELRDDSRVLLHLDVAQADALAPGISSRPLPFAWCHTFGSGRCFTTALGHYASAWEDVTYVRHLDGALTWLLSV